MGTIVTIIIVLLKFFSVIDITWTVVILFAIVLILMDLSTLNFNDVASANYVRILSNEIYDLKEHIKELKQQIDSLESEVNNAKPSNRNYKYDWS